MERKAATVSEVQESTGIGRDRVYKAVHLGELRSIRIGRRIVIPWAFVDEWLRDLSSQNGTESDAWENGDAPKAARA